MSGAEETGAGSPAWTVYCDGSAMPNPGRMGIGAVITAPDGSRHTLSQATHTTGCNNEAELLALTLALHDLRERGAKAVRAYSDNSILVEQLGAAGGQAVAPIVRLAGLFDEARALLGSFDDVRVHWIPRHRNGEADALARAALGFPPKPPARRPRKRR
ncbi:ribonuclease HI family protein [Variovorax sp. NFACC27]|jgi:ribonuclease HI|uniref:ribonuclease HI family protein n=1 Tax=unclassified Variovorax TaxID=663243 RepID=UPI00089954A9|nr:ribonuclease HI [Variovorax sp. NFACC28]SEG91660.1 ribonuclease HI [Variovorax sp. NFACC29]SFD51061.1 ribonuclease HI [Variovorax sp. NFACC26]SFG71739.1 ribonuclease HI [Variovorax sp. NFACC27]